MILLSMVKKNQKQYGGIIMDKLIIQGGTPLIGEVNISGVPP